MGGGNVSNGEQIVSIRGLSPRGRGKRVLEAMPFHKNRSIPAWAGETLHRRRKTDLAPVYPRVGGGNSAG